MAIEAMLRKVCGEAPPQAASLMAENVALTNSAPARVSTSALTVFPIAALWPPNLSPFV